MLRATALLAFLLAGVALLPLRLALPDGLGASAARGTIWDGHLDGAHWRGVGLGSVDLGLQPLALLTGEVRLALRGADLEGVVIAGEGVDGLTARRVLTGLPITSVIADGVSLRFEDGQCLAAAGVISATLPGSAALLSGSPRCAGDAASLRLASVDGLVSVTLSVGGDGALKVVS